MPYGINTNFNRYCEIRPAYLKVSLDGWDRESYIEARGVDRYEETVDNVRRYMAEKGRLGWSTKVGLQCVARDSESVERFCEACRDIPCDYISIRPVESTLGRHYSGAQDNNVDSIIETAVKMRHEDQRIIVNPKFFQLDTIPSACSANWLQIAVDEVGQVVYCCHKPYEVVGSVFDDGILERLAAWETDMSMCDVPCRLTSSNKLVERVASLRECFDAPFI